MEVNLAMGSAVRTEEVDVGGNAAGNTEELYVQMVETGLYHCRRWSWKRSL